MDFTMKECAGCTTCEIACSYRHTGEFNHNVSSIQIIVNQEEPGYKVRLTTDASTGRIPCDGCKDVEGEALCMRYCHKRDDLKIILDQFISSCPKAK